MVDHHLVNKKLSLLEEYESFITKNKSRITAENIKKKFGLRLEVAYALQTIIQTCIDIATHLASDEKWELPDNAAHAFKIALRHSVISKHICGELEKAVKLRNIIVHQYDELDENILEEVVQKKIYVFIEFKEEIRRWLKKKSKKV